jgi:hypothetical protein
MKKVIYGITQRKDTKYKIHLFSESNNNMNINNMDKTNNEYNSFQLKLENRVQYLNNRLRQYVAPNEDN